MVKQPVAVCTPITRVADGNCMWVVRTASQSLCPLQGSHCEPHLLLTGNLSEICPVNRATDPTADISIDGGSIDQNAVDNDVLALTQVRELSIHGQCLPAVWEKVACSTGVEKS
jgi:hypothetical protein